MPVTPTDRYLFDLTGYLHIKGAPRGGTVHSLLAAACIFIAAVPGRAPRGARGGGGAGGRRGGGAAGGGPHAASQLRPPSSHAAPLAPSVASELTYSRMPNA
jgi:hypothetical protein